MIMGKTIFDISMSLDGYVTAAGQTAEEPLGRGGEHLHDWSLEPDPVSDELQQRAIASIGAMICGRRTYDDSLPWWEADGPTGARRLPIFVVTHAVPESVPENGVYHFVTDGLEQALEQARTAAGEQDVVVMGGADTIQQYLRAGLIDEIGIHLVPVIFGGGTRLFDAVSDAQVQLDVRSVVDTPRATHLRYRVIR
jgi:dihydrofolate reductase